MNNVCDATQYKLRGFKHHYVNLYIKYEKFLYTDIKRLISQCVGCSIIENKVLTNYS